MSDGLIRFAVSVFPVVVFLVALIFLDSYKLIRFRSVASAVAFGVLAGIASFILSSIILGSSRVAVADYARYAAPPLEEALKAFYLVYLMRTRRIGFMVDGAILGFAVGAGFAIIENAYFLGTLTSTNIILWIVRGFGTAIMHGGVTALVAIIGVSLSERSPSWRYRVLLPGLVAAMIIHSLYNHFFLSPVASAIAVVVLLPLLMTVIFRRSEQGLRQWLGIGFDSDAQLLEMITTGDILENRIGRYLTSLKTRLPGEAVADVLCLIRLHVELAIKAKGVLLMREAGFDVAPDPEVREKFDEMRYLEKSIGPTGRIAIEPIMHWRSRDLWQLYMLGKK